MTTKIKTTEFTIRQFRYSDGTYLSMQASDDSVRRINAKNQETADAVVLELGGKWSAFKIS